MTQPNPNKSRLRIKEAVFRLYKPPLSKEVTDEASKTMERNGGILCS